MDNDALKSKSNDRSEVFLILPPILLGIFGYLSFVVSIWVALMFDAMGGACLVITILLTPWALIVGAFAIVFFILDLRKFRQRSESLEEGIFSKLPMISMFLNAVVLIGVILGYFSFLC